MVSIISRTVEDQIKVIDKDANNQTFQIWNAISSKVNINVSMFKFKSYVKLFLLENELMITYHYYLSYSCILY